MAGKGSEVLEILYKSDRSFSDSSNGSVSSTANEIYDVAVTDAVRNEDSGQRKYCTKISCGRLCIITQDTEMHLLVILDPEMAQKI
jgi:hypothetical protein